MGQPNLVVRMTITGSDRVRETGSPDMSSPSLDRIGHPLARAAMCADVTRAVAACGAQGFVCLPGCGRNPVALRLAGGYGRGAPDASFAHPRLAAVYNAFDGPRDDLAAYLRIATELGANHMLDVDCGQDPWPSC